MPENRAFSASEILFDSSDIQFDDDAAQQAQPAQTEQSVSADQTPSWMQSPMITSIAQGAVAPMEAARAATMFGAGLGVPSPAGVANVLQPMAEAGQATARLGGMVGPKTQAAAEFLTPQTQGQAAGQLVAEATIAKAGKYLAGRMAPTLDAKAMELVALAKKYNIPLTAADIAKSDWVVKLENTLAKTPIAGDVISKFRKSQLARMSELADSIVSKLGPGAQQAKEDVAKALGAAQTAALKSLSRTRDQAYALYDEALTEFTKKNGAIKADASKLLPETIDISKDIVSDEGKSAVNSILGNIDDAIDISTGQRYREGPPQITLEGIRIARERIAELMDKNKLGQAFMSSKEERAASLLYSRLGEVEKTAVEKAGGNLRSLLADANVLHAKGKAITGLKSAKMIRNALVNDGETASKLYDRFIVPNNSSQIRMVRKIVGEKGFENVQGRFVNNIISAAGEGFENPSAMLREWARWNKPGDNAIEAILPKETISALSDLVTLVKGTRLDTKGFQGSAGAQFVKSLLAASSAGSAMGAYVAGAPGAVVGSAAGPITAYTAAKVYLSPIGRKLMAEGYTIPAGTAAAAKWSARVSAFAASKAVSPTKEKK